MDNINPPQKPLFIGDSVHQIIPQKPPMVMIDTVIHADTERAKTALTITEENVFCDEGFFQAPGLSENIAQASAAQIGYLAHLAGEEPPVGFIGAIKNLIIEQLPKVGDQLITEIEVEHQIMNFILINGISKVGDQIMAKCQMKIFIVDKEQA
jgi:3-hydroxymyristoyl/3-hydroxydecanoyl-(acyl carrier protein) dehydratase